MSEDLPKGWCRVRVGDLARPDEQPVLTGPFGTNMGKDDFVASGCPVLTIGCLTDAGIKLDKAMFVQEDKAVELGRYRLRTGDLLFSRMASVGRAGMVPEALDGALFNYHIMRLRLADEKMLPELFLAYVRGAPAVRKYLEDVNHGATRDGINTSQLVEMPVALPPLNEQRRIVAKLEALQARSRRAREALDALPPLLEKLRQSILAAAFRGDLTKDWRAKHKDVEPASELLKRIRAERKKKWEEAELAKMKAKGKPPTDDKWKAKYKEPAPVDTTGLPDLPEGWCWASLESLSDAERGIPYGIVLTGDHIHDGVPTVRCGDIKAFHIKVSALKRVKRTIADEFTRTRLEGGEVLLAIRGTVGATAIATADMAGMNISREVAMIPLLAGVAPRYLMYCLASPEAESRLMKHVKGVAQAGINLSDLRNLPVPVPPSPEQAAVLKVVEAHLDVGASIVTASASASERISTLERSTLAKAFRGELVPQDPNDEPAEATLARLRGTTNGVGAVSRPAGRKTRAPRETRGARQDEA